MATSAQSQTLTQPTPSGPSSGRVRRIGEYDIGSQRLGRGSFGSVLKGCHATQKFPVAVKVVDFSQTRNAMKEVNVLSKLNHPNLVHLYDQFKNAKYVFSVLEYCAGGSLRDALQRAVMPYQRGGGLHSDEGRGRREDVDDSATSLPLPIPLIDESVARRLSAELLDALCYLNSPSVKLMHRDLKPANILLTDEDLTVAHVRVADLGFAQELRTEGHLLQSLIGTAMYMAPERLNGEPYDFQAEVWAAGLIIYELLFGELPWNPSGFRELTEMVEHAPLLFPTPDDTFRRGPGISDAAKDLLRRMLKPNPAERITIEEARRHEWLADVPPLTEAEAGRVQLRPNHSVQPQEQQPDAAVREDASVGTQTSVVEVAADSFDTASAAAVTNRSISAPPPPKFSVNPMNDEVGLPMPTRGGGGPPPPAAPHHVDPRSTISPRTTSGSSGVASLFSSGAAGGAGGARAGSSGATVVVGGRPGPTTVLQHQQSPPLGPTGTPPSGIPLDAHFLGLPPPTASTVTNTSSLSTSTTAARGVSPVPSAAPYAPVCPPARLMLEVARAVAWIAEEASEPAERVVLYCHAATVATSFDRSSPCARDIILFCEECLAAARRHAVLIEPNSDGEEGVGAPGAARTATPQYLMFEAICKNIYAMHHSDEFVALPPILSDAFYLGTMALCEALVEDPDSDAQIKDRAQQWIPQLQRKWDLHRESRLGA